MVQGKSFVSALMAGAASLALVVGSAAPACAQSASRGYSIASQPLAQALMALSRAANVDIVAPARLTRGRVAGAVTGAGSVEAALRQMLAGTGLTFRAKGRGYVILAPESGSTQERGEVASAQAGRGVIVGTLHEETTGSALKGARVQIRETGEVTATDGNGNFRFANVPSGQVTLLVSYLGYPTSASTVVVEPQRTASTAIVLSSDPQAAEIVVTGQVSARAQALNQERTAENASTVVSADLLGNFQGATIAEALRRTPGVAFEQDPNTGDGTKVIVRGLAPDYNQVELNGQPLLAAGNSGRSADLSGILADSVSQVRISKTLLPNQDSSGTGGLVEIETKSPLDRPRRYADLGVEYKKRAGDFGDDFLATGTLSFRFGSAKNFGLSVSAQHRRQTVTNFHYAASGNVGPYLPVAADGTPLAFEDIDPRRRFPFEAGVDGYYLNFVNAGYSRNKTETTAVTVSSEWQVSDHSNWRLDYTFNRRGVDYSDALNALNGSPFYDLASVPSAGGASRYVLQETLGGIASTIYMAGAQYREQSNIVSFRGKSEFGPLSVNYQAGYNDTRSVTPYSYSVSLGGGSLPITPDMLLPGATDARTGQITSLWGARTGSAFPLPLLTGAGFDVLDSAQSGGFSFASEQRGDRGRSRAYNGELQFKLGLGRVFKYLESGISYKNSRFQTVFGQTYGAFGNGDFVGGNYVLPSADAVGLRIMSAPFGEITGSGRPLQVLDPASYATFMARQDQLASSGLISNYTVEGDPVLNRMRTTEGDFAAYIQGRIDIGRLEVIGGVRMSRVRVDAEFPNGIRYTDATGAYDQAYFDATRVIVSGSATQTNFLPRVLANFRLNDRIVFRAGYFASVARPQVQLLTSTQGISVNLQPVGGPAGNQPTLIIDTGNPDLKPASTHNFDFSAEYYDKDVGVVKLGAFYKRLDNLLESNSVVASDGLDGFQLPDDPHFQNLPANLFITYRRPVNNPDPGKIWGIEASVEKRLTFLPGALRGLGVYANYTYTQSRKTALMSWYTKPALDGAGNPTRVQEDYLVKNVPFAGQPPHSGTIGLTYSGGGLDASVMYTIQARRLSSLGNFGLDVYDEATDSLDMRASYQLDLWGTKARVYVEGNNLLKGAGDASVQQSVGGNNGVPRSYIGGSFLGGRAVTAGISVAF